MNDGYVRKQEGYSGMTGLESSMETVKVFQKEGKRNSRRYFPLELFLREYFPGYSSGQFLSDQFLGYTLSIHCESVFFSQFLDKSESFFNRTDESFPVFPDFFLYLFKF